MKSTRFHFNHIYLEITNICNLDCPFCSPQVRSKEMMTLSDVRRIVPELKQYTDALYLHIKGEPLMHPHFSEIIDIIIENGLSVKLTTNGTMLLEHWNALLKVTRLNISFQALLSMDKEKRSVYWSELNTFLDMVDGSDLNISFRVWANKSSLIDEVALFLKNRYNKTLESTILAERRFLSIEKEFDWPVIGQLVESTKCLGGKTHIGILADQSVVLCCLDADGKTSFGSLKKQTLASLLTSENFHKLTQINQGLVNHPLCASCTYRLRFKK